MKHILFAAKKLAATLVVAVALISAQVILSAPAQAEKAPTVILIVDMQALFTISNVGQDIARQLREQAEALQAEDQAVRQSLAAEAESLSAQRESLSLEELDAKVTDLGQRQQMHLQNVSQRQQALQLGQGQANSEVANVIKPILGEILVRHGAGLLIDQANVLAGGLDLNVTPEVIAILNERLPSLTVTPVNPSTVGGGQ